MNELIELAKLLKEASLLFESLSKEKLNNDDITWQQILILEQVKNGQKTIGEIGKAVDLSYSTTSGLVNRLERERLVIRSRDKADRRVVWVAPTKRLRNLGTEGTSPTKLAGMEKNTADTISSLHTFTRQYAEKKSI